MMSDRKNVRKKRLESASSSNEPNVNNKRKSNKKTSDEDSIAVSKQLSKRIQSNGSSRIRTTRSSNKNIEPKICGNGKPMPSLAELEKLFEDSDGDTCESPEKEIPMSPKSIKNIASRLMERITNISDPTELIDVLPPPPIVPQKKPKKSGVPYIIGCKERSQINKKPNTSFCKGDDYGVHLNAATSEDEDSCPQKRQKRSNKANISKSIFNAKSDEIAEKLKKSEDSSDDSTDSNKTVAYTYYNNSELSGRPQSFSPIPSTSRDNETILQNDKRFGCFVSGLGCNNSPNDVEVIEMPRETIVIDDDTSLPKRKCNDEDAVQIIEPSDKGAFNHKPIDGSDIEDSVQIIEHDEVEKTNSINSPIDVDDYYSSIDINQSFDDHVVEEIKIDDLIQENNAIIGKFVKDSKFNVITHVEPRTDKPNILNKTEDQTISGSTKGASNEPTIIPKSFNNTNPHPTNVISETLNRPITSQNSHSASNNGPSETQNSPSTSHNGPSETLNSPSTSHNGLSETHNSPSKTHDRPSETHNSPNKGNNITNFKNTTNGKENINNSGTHSNVPLIRISEISETVDLTKDPDPSEFIRRWENKSAPGYRRGRLRTVHIPAGPLQCHTDRNSFTITIPIRPVEEELMADAIHKKIMVNNLTNNPSPYNILPKNRNQGILKQTVQLQTQPVPSSTPAEESPKRSSCVLGDCPICMDKLGNKAVASTMCGHVFCLKCIKDAFKLGGKRCPTCRKVLTRAGYHQLFL